MSLVSHTEGSFLLLPEALLEEILLRLPAVSLVRFKIVCKLWRALIVDPSFANKHLRSVAHRNKFSSSVTLFLLWKHVKLPILVETPPVVQGMSLINICCNEGQDGASLITCVITEPDVPRFYKKKLGIICKDFKSRIEAYTVNGIICLTGIDRTPESQFVLCNPVLKRAKRLSMGFVDSKLYRYIGEGFAYCSRADDYKFFRIFSAMRNRREHRAYVYTLGSDSWREIGIDNFNISLFGCERTCCGGVFYWRNIALMNSKDMIIAFDIFEEKFRSIALPDGIREAPIYWHRLVVWKDRVVVFNLIETSLNSTVFEMWVMMVDDVDGHSTWTKHLTIGPLIDTHNPLGFWNDDELLMGTVEREVVSYNISTKKIRKLQIGDAVPPSSYHFEVYSESLVSLKSKK